MFGAGGEDDDGDAVGGHQCGADSLFFDLLAVDHFYIPTVAFAKEFE